MMKQDGWQPIFWSPFIMFPGFGMIWLTPETLKANREGMDMNQRGQRTRTNLSVRLRDTFVSSLQLLKIRDVALLIPGASLTLPVATITLGVKLRYLPIRYGLTLEQSGSE